tara:strand:- start:87 stop:932 length:846 start_codon:yes stop_codon:yes gene_type:complete
MRIIINEDIQRRHNQFYAFCYRHIYYLHHPREKLKCILTLLRLLHICGYVFDRCTDAKRSLKRGNGGRTSAHFAANNDLPDDFEEASRILQTEEHRNKMFEYFSSLQADESDIESSPTAVLASFKVLGTVTKAHQYRRRGDIQQAAAFYEKAAKRGSAEGMYNLAIYISEGCGGRDRDFSLAMDYIKQAVRQKAFLRVPGNSLLPNIGVAEAENFMGNSYREGRGVDICFETAFQWHLKSAVHGCLQGMNNVGVALQNGHGCQKNHKEARCWYVHIIIISV